MGSWTDPDLRKHVDTMEDLRVGSFLDEVRFVDKPDDPTTSPYIRKKIGQYSDVKLCHPSVAKLSIYRDKLLNDSPSTSLTDEEKQRPMDKAHRVYGRVHYHTFILYANNMFSMLEFDPFTRSSVRIPSDHQIYDIFEDYMTNRNAPTIKEVINATKIDSIIKKLFIENDDVEYSIAKWIEEKMYISKEDIVNRMKTPLFVNYLSRELSKLLNGVDIPDVSLLRDTMVTILTKLDVYVNENGDDEDV